MKNLALLLLFALTTSSFGDADDERSREPSKLGWSKGSEEFQGNDLGEEKKSVLRENSKMREDSSERDENIRQKMVEKIVNEPIDLSANGGREDVQLSESAARVFEGSEGDTASKIIRIRRSTLDVSKKVSFSPVPTRGIPMDLNMRQTKDLLERAMGYGCDDKTEEEEPNIEMEREFLQYCGFGKLRWMPKKVRFHSKVNDAPNRPCCHPRGSHVKRKDQNLQILDEMMNEMLGLPCDGGNDPTARSPVLYCGVGKLRRVKRKCGKHSKGIDAPKKTSCSPIPRRHQSTDIDLKLLDQLLDGMMILPRCEKSEGGRTPNELEKRVFKYCGFGKIHRMEKSQSHNCPLSVAFNKSSSCGEQNVQCPAGMDVEEVNNLMEEVMEFAGRKEKKGVKTPDLQDWLYGYCGFGKLRRLSFNSLPYRKKHDDTCEKPSCNPLEGPEKHKRKLLHQIGVYLDESLGFDCKDENGEKVDTDKETGAQMEFCGFGKVHILPENYFLDHSVCNISKPASRSRKQGFGDPMDLSLKQMSGLLEERMGLPKGGVVDDVGQGLYLICAPTKTLNHPKALDACQSSSDISVGNIFSPISIG